MPSVLGAWWCGACGVRFAPHASGRLDSPVSSGPRLPAADSDPHLRFLKERRQTEGTDHCYICGRHIPRGSEKWSVEHVFPKWLLRNLSLFESTITSINRQSIKYSQLTVPCCTQCNNVEFSQIEERIKDAFSSGVDAVRSLDRRDLFLWLAKVYYGVVYLESLRVVDVRDRTGPPLVPGEHLRSVRFVHFLLQAASGAVVWEPASPGPASLLVFECQTDPENPRNNFDYIDNLFSPLIAIRAGSIGIIAVLEDWGFLEEIREKRFDAAAAVALHPTQFRELFAMASYISEENWVGGRQYLVLQPPSGPPEAVIIAPEVSRPAGGSVDIARYAGYLASALETSLDEVFGEGGVKLLLVDEEGDPLTLPWPGGLFVGNSGAALWPASRKRL